MATDLDERSISEIQTTLKRLREQNREIATDNRIIREQIRLIERRTENLQKDFNDQKNDIDVMHEKTMKSIEAESNIKDQERKEKKKKLLREMKERTTENSSLEDQIRNLQQQIVHFRRMNATLPKATAAKKTITKKKTKRAKSPLKK